MSDTKLVRIGEDTSKEIEKQMHRLQFNTRKSTVAVAVALLAVTSEEKVINAKT